MKALSFDHVSHRFGTRLVLDDLSFAVEEGSFTVLLGPNGAGKSTLVSLATGLHAAQAGEIRLFGASPAKDTTRALARIGVVFQSSTLDLDLTVRESLSYSAALHGLPARQAMAAAEQELDRLGLRGRMNELARSLSGGMRRKIEIARALLHDPGLLILDEATVGLDAASRQDLILHVRDLCVRRGLAVLWATHLLDEVQPDDRLVVLDGGHRRFTGPASELAGAGSLKEAFLALTGAPA